MPASMTFNAFDNEPAHLWNSHAQCSKDRSFRADCTPTSAASCAEYLSEETSRKSQLNRMSAGSLAMEAV